MSDVVATWNFCRSPLALVAVPSQCGLYWFLISVSFVFTNQTNGSLDAKIVLLVIHCWIRVSIIIRIPCWDMLFFYELVLCLEVNQGLVWPKSLNGCLDDGVLIGAEALEDVVLLWVALMLLMGELPVCAHLQQFFQARICCLSVTPRLIFLFSVWLFRRTLSLTCSTIRSYVYEITLVLLLSYLIDRTVSCISHNLLQTVWWFGLILYHGWDVLCVLWCLLFCLIVLREFDHPPSEVDLRGKIWDVGLKKAMARVECPFDQIRSMFKSIHSCWREGTEFVSGCCSGYP